MQDGVVITERRLWAPGLYTLRFDARLDAFHPGQFVNMALQVGGQWVRRSYSLASAPGAPLEIFLNEVAGGGLTPSLLSLPVGAKVRLDPTPRGFFTLEHVPDAEELWMVATGTGLGPFISMLRAGEPQARFKRVVLVHGVRLRRHAAYEDELSRWTADSGGRFSRILSVTGEPAEPGDVSGRIQEALKDGRIERHVRVQIEPSKSHVMLCGNPGMIDGALGSLALRGMRKHRRRAPGHITAERYW